MKGCCRNLGKSGKVALAVVGNATLYQDAAILANTYCGRLLRRTGTKTDGAPRILNEGGQADA